MLSSANDEWGHWCDWSHFILHIKYQISIVSDNHLFFGTNYNIHWTNINNKIIEHRSYASFARCLPKTSGMMSSCDNREKNRILKKNRSSPTSTSITDGFFFDTFERLHVVEFYVIKTNGIGKSLKAVLLRRPAQWLWQFSIFSSSSILCSLMWVL